VHVFLFQHITLVVTVCLFVQSLLSTFSFTAMVIADIVSAMLICWSEFRRSDDSMTFVIVSMVTFLTFFGVSHPDLTFLTRYLVYFGYADLTFSVIKSNVRFFFLAVLLVGLLVSERASITAVLCIGGIGFMSLFVYFSFPSSLFKMQRRVKLDVASIMCAMLFQFILKKPIRRSHLVLAILFAAPDRIPGIPRISFPKIVIAFGIFSGILSVCELCVARRQQSVALMALAIRTCCINGLGLAGGFLSTQPATVQFSFGYASGRVVLSFVVLVVSLFAAFRLIGDSVKRLFHPPFVEERSLFGKSLGFVVVDLFELFQIAVFNLTQKTFRDIEGWSILFSLLGSGSALVSAVLIEVFEVYFVDAASALLIALTLIDFVASLLIGHIDALLLSSGKNDLEMIANVLNAVGPVRDLRIWNAKEDLNVATVKLVKRPDSLVLIQVIEELQKLKIRNITIEGGADA
jgi:Co/Zn/Cd efflux system component